MNYSDLIMGINFSKVHDVMMTLWFDDTTTMESTVDIYAININSIVFQNNMMRLKFSS